MPAAQAVTFMVPEGLADIPPGWLGWGMTTEKLQPGVLLAQWMVVHYWSGWQGASFSPPPATEMLALAE